MFSSLYSAVTNQMIFKGITNLAFLESNQFGCDIMQKGADIAGLRLLSLPSPTCKDGLWLVSMNLYFRKVSVNPKCLTVPQLFVQTMWFMLNTCFLLEVWNFDTCQQFLGLPQWLSGRESTCQCRRCKRLEFDPWDRKTPWGRKWQPSTVFLPGKSHGQRSLVGYSPWGHKRVGHDLVTKQQ